ncbi:MAG: class IV adenylate cyclase [Bacteroidetes bacterium]|nr:MAG: class IV adenylate cyclase [Bacteroidota bacterium]
MLEVEVKILEIRREEVEQRLLSLGAVKTFDGEMYALFYDRPDGSLSARGDVLRLRREGDSTALVYKSPVSREGAKIMQEYETTVGSLEVVHQILEQLDIRPIKKTRKFRTQYDLSGVHIAIDDYQDEMEAIPVFMEIEAPELQSLTQTAALLGFGPDQFLTWSTYELAQHYLKG